MARDICVKIKSGVKLLQVKELIGKLNCTLVLDFDRLRWGLVRVPQGADIFPIIDSLLQSLLSSLRLAGGFGYNCIFSLEE